MCESYGLRCACAEKAINFCCELETELVAVKADTDRLDWLERQDPTLRAAIDDAMKTERQLAT